MTSKPPGLFSVSTSILALLGGAAPSGLLISGAEVQIAQSAVRRRDEEEDVGELLLAVPPDGAQVILASHRSHSSHRSHYSSRHSSHYSGSSAPYVPATPSLPVEKPAPPHEEKPSPPAEKPSPPAAKPPPREAKPPPREEKPPSPKPATVSFVAFPGGRISVDGKAVGQDSTETLKLVAGKHVVRVENRFLGSTTVEVELHAGQTGELKIEW